MAALRLIGGPEAPSQAQAPRGPGRPKGTGWFDANQATRDDVLGLLVRMGPHLTASYAHDVLVAALGSAAPGYDIVKRFLAQERATRSVALLKIHDPDAYRSRFRLAIGRADGEVRFAHQLWEIDTTKADVMDGDGKRWMIMAIIDVWSRRARVQIAPSESAQGVRRFLVDTILSWGAMPHRLSYDNGSGYVNKSVPSALEALGIEGHACNPGSPWEKPFVERFFGTFNRKFKRLPGFTGHNVAQAAKLRAKAKHETGRAQIVGLLSREQIEQEMHGFVEGDYNQKLHGETRVRPVLRMAQSPEPGRAPPSEQALRRALSAHVGTRRLGKKAIVWDSGIYWNDVLADWMGHDVEIRRDEDDLGKLFVFDGEGRWICEAVNHFRSGVSEAEFAVLARAAVARRMAEKTRELKTAAKRPGTDALIDAKRRADAEAAGKLVTLPTRTLPHTTPQLDALRVQPAPVIELKPGTAAAMDRALAPRGSNPFAEWPTDRKAEWTDNILARVATGQPVEEEHVNRAREFAELAEYKAHKHMMRLFASNNTERG